MATSNILSIGQSALSAAQAGISTTGHNIANASTPGYSRQVVIQGSAGAQNFGYGYVGQGTQVTTVQRIFNDLLASQISSSQASYNQINTYASQMSQIDNMLADSSAGISPALQNFFNTAQTLSANPSDGSARQAYLSAAQALASRFQSLGNQLNNINDSVNSQIGSSITKINSYTSQIANLNDMITKAQNLTGQPPNDLLDQRDQLVNDLSKEIKVTVVNQQGSYNVFVGNGQPMVVGGDKYSLVPVSSPTDPTKIEVGYLSKGVVTVLGQQNITGGVLGGLLQFRDESLDSVKNQIGQLALVVGQSINDQNMQGLDLNGAQGSAIFNIPVPTVNASTNNLGNGVVTASVSNANAVTTSNYKVQFDGTNYVVTRLSDGVANTYSSLPQTLDGLTINATGTMQAGDNFLILPTANGAATLSVAMTNINKIAASSPVVDATAATTNAGTATVSTPIVNSSYAGSPLAAAFTLTYNSATNELSGFPSGGPQTYTSGATITVGNMSFVLTGTPTNGDQFTVSPTTANSTGDNRNALGFVNLQTSKLVGGTSTFIDAFAQLVSNVGNKTNELNITGTAEKTSLGLLTDAQQSDSGVNLDEEATNLLRYQQAYQAAAKMMQIASQLFDTLLSIGT